MQSTCTQEQNMEDYTSATAELNYRLGFMKASKPHRSSAPIQNAIHFSDLTIFSLN